MSRSLLLLSAALVSPAGLANAEIPDVAADIAPIHSLVARVMDGAGMPDLVIQPGGSPHEYSLRPSEAAALDGADVVFWVGEALTPWMEGTLDTLAEGATVVSLLEAEGTEILETRTGVFFEAHADHGHDVNAEGHDHADADADDHDHADHAEGHDHADDHADHADDHEDHAEAHGHSDHDDHADHDHGPLDAHAWLAPANARAWLETIAVTLSEVDPENAALYAANAAAGQAEIDALTAEITEILAPLGERRHVVFHDAYQYFESAFDVPAAGAISLSDATDPSPARIAAIRDRIRDEGIDCVLAEPQFNPGVVATVLDGTDAETGVMDPLGADLAPGPGLYPELLRAMARNLADCL